MSFGIEFVNIFGTVKLINIDSDFFIFFSISDVEGLSLAVFHNWAMKGVEMAKYPRQ